MHLIANIAIDAIAYGMVLFIISIGLSVMMGLMKVINLAHGAFAMVGGYLASHFLVSWGWDFIPAVAVAVGATVLISLPVEILLYRRMYKSRDPLVHLLMTIGITFLEGNDDLAGLARQQIFDQRIGFIKRFHFL